MGLPAIKNYDRSIYNGGTQNWDIDQDRSGNMYFANNKGLLQFDGTQWRLYKMQHVETVRSMKIAASGKIFVGGYREFGYFDSNPKGELIYTSLTPLLKAYPKETLDFIWKIHEYDGGIVFQAFSCAFFYKNNELQILEAPHRFQFSFVVNGKLYFQDVKQGILHFHNQRLEPLPSTEILGSTEIWSILPYGLNQLLVVTLNKGAFVYANGRLKPWQNKANDFIKKNHSLGAVYLNDEVFVFNTIMDGMLLCHRKGSIIQHINAAKGLLNSTVLSSFVDKQHNIWLGLDNGLSFIQANSPLSYFGLPYQLSTVYASVLFEDKIYVATNRGIFYNDRNLNASSGTFRFVEGTLGQNWNIQVLDDQLICSNNNGALLIGRDHFVTPLDTRGYFKFIEHPRKKGYMIGCNYNGFALFEKRGTTWQYVCQIEGTDLSSIHFEMDADYLWLIKDEKLYQFTFSSNLKRFTQCMIHHRLSSSDKGIKSLQRINGRLYFQNQNHFYTYSNIKKAFVEDSSFGAVFQDVPSIQLMQQDRYGHIWFTTAQGLSVLEKQKLRLGVKSIIQHVLAPQNLNEYLAITAVDSRQVYIGLTKGLAQYNPLQRKTTSAPPTVVIRDFITNSDTLLQGNRRKDVVPIQLPFVQNKVFVTYASPNFDPVETVQFSVQLEGLDEKWSSWTSLSSKEYTNLHEGTYILKVRVKNSFGVVSAPTQLTFTILPPWYRSTLAYFGYFVTLVALFVFIRKRINAKIRQTHHLEAIEQRKQYLEKESQIRKEQYRLEQEIIKLNHEQLQSKIQAKDQDLVHKSFQFNRINKLLNGILTKIKAINSPQLDKEVHSKLLQLQRNIEKEVSLNNKNRDLEKHVQNVHYDFVKRLKSKYPEITARELDLATYLIMNLSTKDIAELRNISLEGVESARYRLRKKLNLSKNESLTGFLLKI